VNEKDNTSPFSVSIESELEYPVEKENEFDEIPFTEISTDAPFHPSPKLSCISIV
jgi:hypothetical protein